MALLLQRNDIGDGVGFTQINDSRFKTNRLSIHLIVPLKEANASANAMIPFLIRKGYRGCSDFTALNQKLDRLYGASLYTDVLKSGDFQILNIAISSIDDRFALEKESITGEASEILCNLLFRPAFVEKDFDLAQFELEKQSLIDAIEAEVNEKTTFAVQRMLTHMCSGEAYGIHRYGSVEQIRNLSLDDVRSAYYNVLQTARAEIYFVGCGTEEEVKDNFSDGFSAQERKPLQSIDSYIVSKAEKVNTVTEQYDVAQAKLVMGFRVGASSMEEMQHARLMCLLFGGTPRSKLFMNVREKLSLCYYCSSRLDRNKGIMYVNSGVEHENVEQAKEEILHQLEQIKSGSFADEELNETKLMAVDSLRVVNDSASSMEGWYLSQIFLHSQASPEEEAEQLLKITRDQIIAAANRVTLDTIYLLSGEDK